MQIRQQQRTALITGASRGLGLALARGLARRGWNLILTARDEQRLRTVRDELAAVTHVAAIGGDVTTPAHRQALAVLARGHAGLDAVINNAGALGPSPQPELFDYPLEIFSKVFEAVSRISKRSSSNSLISFRTLSKSASTAGFICF